MTLRVEVDQETMQPTDQLDKSALFWSKKQIGGVYYSVGVTVKPDN